METLRKEILNVLADAPNLLSGCVGQYCDVFFNRRSKGNTCVVLGIKKQELLTELFGFRFPNLIKDDVHYLVRVKSVKTPEALITFRGSDNGYTAEQQERFKTLFSHYNAEKNLNLSSVFAQKKMVPPLIIKAGQAMEFMDNPNENFRILDGEDKLIEKVEIKHPKVIDVELYKSLDDVFIIPGKYSVFAKWKRLYQQDVEQEQQKANAKTSTTKDSNVLVFWEYFSKNVCDIDKINFVIFNHDDDFMVLSFCNLIEHFRRKYANINLLKRIFFVYDEKVKSNKASASSILSNATKKLFKELHNSLLDINTTDDCALYVCTLELLEALDTETKQKNVFTLYEIKKLLFDALKNNLLK